MCNEKKFSSKIFTKNSYEFLKLERDRTADLSDVDIHLIDRKIINSACKRKAVVEASVWGHKTIIKMCNKLYNEKQISKIIIIIVSWLVKYSRISKGFILANTIIKNIIIMMAQIFNR